MRRRPSSDGYSRSLSAPSGPTEALVSLGYAVGSVDGVVGSQTREAVRSLQSDRGMEPTGYISRDILEALNIEPQGRLTEEFRSSKRLQTQDTELLRAVGEDPGIIKILECLEKTSGSNFPLIYEQYGGHWYVAFNVLFYSYKVMSEISGKCSGYLTLIDDSQERTFLRGLIKDEPSASGKGFTKSGWTYDPSHGLAIVEFE
jgi:Putative peptidoglycan binding domain